jgi:hypothetical protein
VKDSVPPATFNGMTKLCVAQHNSLGAVARKICVELFPRKRFHVLSHDDWYAQLQHDAAPNKQVLHSNSIQTFTFALG